MNKPQIDKSALPQFSAIRPAQIQATIEKLISDNKASVEKLLAANTDYSWENLVQALENDADRLNRAWSPVNHLHSVADSDELREAYNACLPLLTEYGTELGQHEGLFRAYQQIRDSAGFSKLHAAQQKSIDNELRDFRLSGIGLAEEERQHYSSIKQKLSKLQTRYEENLLDATQAWQKLIVDKQELAGLPESAIALAAQTAEREKQTGWLLTLEFPSYLPLMQYADNRELREEVYQAYVTRASEQGPNAGQWDNGELMVKIVELRQQLAQLLGFDTYADYSLARKMASTPAEVLSFLEDLAARSRPVAGSELAELQQFAREKFGVDELKAWDLGYYSEKLRVHKFDISQEELRPYFPAPRVIEGMFAVVKRLYGIDIQEVEGIDSWHEDVRFYEIQDESGQLRGSFYLDLYARPQKRGGAWMDECLVRRFDGEKLQTPVAYLTCNFTPAIGTDPSLLTHDEVITLFHEFGHGLHHMLTLVDYAEVSGINGVAWDAVELPSQFMENWCWERDSIALISGHYESGEALPDELYEKMLKARTFHAGMQMVRQLELSLFDFRLHHEHKVASTKDIQALLNQVREQVAVVSPPEYNRFQHSFSHIFAGGYAAGYYSYKWAEVLSADAFSKFEENGIFDRKTGEQFLNSILEQGGSREPMELFIEFRGRKPTIDALLRHSGIIPEGATA